MMYEVARQLTVERQRTARQAGEAYQQRAAAREQRAAARASRGRKRSREIAAPVIPDFAHEMFGADSDTVPAPREEVPAVRHARMRR